jgi:hypothetical protein
MKKFRGLIISGIVLAIALVFSVAVEAQDSSNPIQPQPTVVPFNTLTIDSKSTDICSLNKLEGYTPVFLSLLNKAEGPSTVMLENTGWSVRILQVSVVKEGEMMSASIKIGAEGNLPDKGETLTLVNDVGFDTGLQISVRNCEGTMYYDFPTQVPFPPAKAS